MLSPREPGAGHMKRHFLALDGLRGVAAVAVMLFHRRWWGPHGHLLDHADLAVDFFFVLSGFVINHAYADRLSTGLSPLKFTRLRVVRLFPLILVGAILGLLVGLLLGSSNGTQPASVLVWFLLGAICLPVPRAMAKEPFPINRPTWSLFYELVANAIFALCIVRLSDRVVAMLTALAAAGMLAMLVMLGKVTGGYDFGQLGWGLVRVAYPFLMGVLLHRLRHRIRVPAMPFWLATLLLLAVFIPGDLGAIEPWFQGFAVLILFPLIVLAAHEKEPPRRWLPWVQFSAFISYPVYALHYPVLDAMSWLLPRTHLPYRLWLPVSACLCVAIAWAVARFVEPRMRDLFNRMLVSREVSLA
jgi:peptidoglycan/LPS O-acetylase OafA/YrhL